MGDKPTRDGVPPLVQATVRRRTAGARRASPRRRFREPAVVGRLSRLIALIPRLARPPLGRNLISRPLRRQPKREVHAVWRRSADASPAIRAVVAKTPSPG